MLESSASVRSPSSLKPLAHATAKRSVLDFEHALEALTIATDPLDAVDGNPSLICTAKCPESSARSDCHSRCTADVWARVRFRYALDGVQPRSDARASLRSGRGLDPTHEMRETTDRFEC